MDRYEVTVTNEHTGEVVTIVVDADCGRDAQVKALTLLFRERGWRKASARPVDGAIGQQPAGGRDAA